MTRTADSVLHPETSSVTPGSAHAWLLAARPATLTAAFVPVLVGSACARAVNSLRVAPALAALLAALLLQIAANLANDVFDHEKGADTPERLGPTRAVQSGLLSPRSVRGALGVSIALSVLLGTYLAYVAGPAVIALGLLAIAAAVAYTAGPYPLSYHGLGEVFVMIFFGFVAVCGTTYVQVGTVSELAWWCALPVGCLATAVLVVNNVRDLETDAKAGKRTIAVRLGRQAAVLEYLLLILAAHLVPVVLVGLGRLGQVGLLPLLTLAPGLALALQVHRRRGRPLNATLVRTAQLLLAHGVLLAAAVWLGARPP
jgi:1,4-dihydroxy-2-naphthoate octaprenyltransferase